jgi:hypothetical protein
MTTNSLAINNPALLAYANGDSSSWRDYFISAISGEGNSQVSTPPPNSYNRKVESFVSKDLFGYFRESNISSINSFIKNPSSSQLIELIELLIGEFTNFSDKTTSQTVNDSKQIISQNYTAIIAAANSLLSTLVSSQPIFINVNDYYEMYNSLKETIRKYRAYYYAIVYDKYSNEIISASNSLSSFKVPGTSISSASVINSVTYSEFINILTTINKVTTSATKLVSSKSDFEDIQAGFLKFLPSDGEYYIKILLLSGNTALLSAISQLAYIYGLPSVPGDPPPPNLVEISSQAAGDISTEIGNSQTTLNALLNLMPILLRNIFGSSIDSNLLLTESSTFTKTFPTQSSSNLPINSAALVSTAASTITNPISSTGVPLLSTINRSVSGLQVGGSISDTSSQSKMTTGIPTSIGSGVSSNLPELYTLANYTTIKPNLSGAGYTNLISSSVNSPLLQTADLELLLSEAYAQLPVGSINYPELANGLKPIISSFVNVQLDNSEVKTSNDKDLNAYQFTDNKLLYPLVYQRLQDSLTS